jgi:hypothetical protein
MPQTTIHSSSGGTGYIRSQSAVWATARGAATGNFNSTSDSGEIQAGASLNGGTYDIKHAFIRFDTSSIPDDATITAATLRLFGRATDTTRTLDVFEGTQSTTIEDADFDALNSTEFGSEVFTGSDAWEEIELNASGIAIINKTGNTFLALKHQWDTDNTTPNTNDQFMIWDTHDGTNPEELVVTYSVPGGGAFLLTTL